MKDGCASYCTAYLWIVPAKVEGTWQLGDGELTLKQTYQMISGSLRRGGNTVQIANGKLNGDQITFNAGGSLYTGRVKRQWHGRDNQLRRQLESEPGGEVGFKTAPFAIAIEVLRTVNEATR